MLNRMCVCFVCGHQPNRLGRGECRNARTCKNIKKKNRLQPEQWGILFFNLKTTVPGLSCGAIVAILFKRVPFLKMYSYFIDSF